MCPALIYSDDSTRPSLGVLVVEAKFVVTPSGTRMVRPAERRDRDNPRTPCRLYVEGMSPIMAVRTGVAPDFSKAAATMSGSGLDRSA
jgi:hypothetical protein